MRYNILKTKTKKIKLWLITLVGFIVILPAVWILLVRLEGEKPSIMLELPSLSIKASQELSVSVSDIKSGIRRVWIGLLKDGKESVLFERDFPAAGLLGGGKIHEKSFKIKVEPEKMGISDGKAILRMVARDFSWRGWWHGNKTYIEKDIMIDTRPPEVDVLTRVHNISQGGAGLVIYKLSEPCPKSGVCVGENYFPGHSGFFKDTKILMAFFALDYKQGPGTKIFVKATDQAGNSARAGFPCYIKKKVFKKDVINISDRFLDWKMPEFETDIPQNSSTSMINKFLMVNRDLRLANYKKITGLGEKTGKVLYWDGVFLRLPKSANRAGFADHREYKYKGRIIDRQVHLGIDLASIAHSPVPASNKGKVVFAGPIDIYGKTVMIDHGFGLLSMYSHLSSYDVQEGQIVSKGEIIGRTGITGLAGGDHLHFSILIHNTFVNPLEWWDAAWIKNNITNKINEVKSR